MFVVTREKGRCACVREKFEIPYAVLVEGENAACLVGFSTNKHEAGEGRCVH